MAVVCRTRKTNLSTSRRESVWPVSTGSAMQSKTDRYVLVDGGIGHIAGIRESVRLSGVDLRVARSMTEALGNCGSHELPGLVLVGVRDSNVDAISGCRDMVPGHEPSIIAFGPARAPALRVLCFRAGAVDYIDAGASPKELDMRIGMHLRTRLELTEAPTPQESQAFAGSRKHEIYRLAVKYLSQTEIGNISQQSLASRIGVSVGHLDAAFRSVLGHSVVRFLKRRRLDLAAMLLTRSNMSVTAIAELLGYSDGANFATAFKLDVGLTPSEYRERADDECQRGGDLPETEWRGDSGVAYDGRSWYPGGGAMTSTVALPVTHSSHAPGVALGSHAAVRSTVWILTESAEAFGEMVDELRAQLFDVRVVNDGWTSYYEALVSPPTAFVVDGALSGMDASAFCCLVSGSPRLRGVPVVYVDTAAASEARTRALASGAADCIVFPFMPEELIARLRVQLRIVRGGRGPVEPERSDRAWRSTHTAMTLIKGGRIADMSARALANAVGASHRRLSRDFKDKLGVSASEYLRREKLERAAWLLQYSGISVTDIAREVGFRSPCNFSVAFKKHTDLTPSQFRAVRQSPKAVA
ncbi:helix-turn-helix domain-containing protein [Pandoraea sp. NPDC087047]|uniref:helix-turn-helix domain-containing protein n=1 Tax=Pandoraea sp. NPDC087047 TaxID=3364390 RepID=UPI00382979B5